MATPRLIKSLLTCLLVALAAQQIGAQDRAIRRADDKTASGIPERHALIVGNDAYRRSALVNAVNDAFAMGETLREMGFSVQTLTDADYPTMDRAIDLFVDRLSRGDVALFYYAGHGVQVDGENYLIPTDFDRARVAKVKYRALPANLIRERMENSGARLSILILDACRDNPFSGNRSAGQGLAQMSTGIGTFIAFSTAPGQTATDNPTASNGLFTHHLIQTLATPGLSIDEIFNEVRRQVFQASDGRQIPWTASSLIGSFYFQPGEGSRPGIAVSRRQATGSLAVTVNQGDASIHLDGDRVATSTGAEIVHLDDVPIGSYRLRVSKPGFQDVSHTVRVEHDTVKRLEAWLFPQTAGGRIAPDSSPQWTTPAPSTQAQSTDFCATLEQVLMACPDQFRDIVVPSRSRTWTFLEPTVVLPGAWYSRVHRADSGGFEYLSSFETGLSANPGRRLRDFVHRVEACLPADAIDWRQRRATQHQLQVGLAPGDCRLDVAVNGETVDLEIYPD